MTKEQELHMMQLAAISTACMQNTESTIRDRIPRESEYWTVAYGDVCKTVDREMYWRKFVEECAEDDLDRVSPRLKKKAQELLDPFNRPR